MMDSTVIVALISFGGTAIGTLVGIITSARLTTYRIKQLEIKVDKHNCLIERMYKVEDRAASNTHRLDKLEEK
jgi:hypothetical protein